VGWLGGLGVTASLKLAVAHVRNAGEARLSSARASVSARQAVLMSGACWRNCDTLLQGRQLALLRSLTNVLRGVHGLHRLHELPYRRFGLH